MMRIEEELKQNSFRDEAQKAAVNLIFTGNLFIQNQQEMLKPFGLTIQQFNVLRILKGQKGNPITVLGITERMLDKMSNASRLVDKLLEKKLVLRRECSLDRRAVDIIILPEGLKLLDKIEDDLLVVATKINQLGQENLIQLNLLLDQFRSSIFQLK